MVFAKRLLKFLVIVIVAIALLLALVWAAGPLLLRGDGDMADPRSEIHAAELDGVIYTSGGIGFFRTLDSCAAFDTQTREFSACPDLPRSLHHVGMAAGEGEIFASGGYVSLPFNQDPEGALFAFAPGDAKSKWRELSQLPVPLGQHAMFYRDGAVWLVGGESGETALGTIHRYTLASGIWDEARPMPTPRHSHAIALSDDKLFVTGGRSETLGSQARVVEAYDFASDSWETLPELPYAIAGHGAMVFEGHLHVFGGENLAKVEVVSRHVSLDLANPESGWGAQMPVRELRHGFATARVGDTVWILGGGESPGSSTPLSVTGTAIPLDLRAQP